MPTKTKTKPDGTTTITMKSIEVTMPQYDFDRLMKEHDKNLKRIDTIRNNVAGEYDNLGKPVPLFEQL